MAEPQPNVGELLGPFFAQLSAPSRPSFLAQLERIAAERYRYWATLLPEHAAQLLACADDEEAVAARVLSVFPVDDATQASMDALVVAARQAYVGLFDGCTVDDQLGIQAAAERQGAQAWRGIAAAHHDPNAVVELEACAALEERSAGRLDEILAS